MVTCPNPACGRFFDNPMKALNMRAPGNPYMACPFCLTEVSTISHKSRGQAHGEKRASKETEKRNEKPEGQKPENCSQHYGFLSERENKQQIPDECMVCSVLLDCMLQKVRVDQDKE